MKVDYEATEKLKELQARLTAAEQTAKELQAKKTWFSGQGAAEEAKRKAAAFKGELIKGWAKAADEEKAVKAAFGALKGDEPFVADGDPKNGASAITDFFKPKPQPDGTITHFYKPQTTTDDAKRYVVVDETVEAIAPATPPFAPPARVMPDVRYADCDNSVPANGAARNEAPTSMFGPGP